MNVGDAETMKTRILAEQCKTCIVRPPGQRIPLDNERVTEFLREAVARQSYVVCHSTLPVGAPEGVEPAVCRGFADRYDTVALRAIRDLWGFVEVPAPDTNG